MRLHLHRLSFDAVKQLQHGSVFRSDLADLAGLDPPAPVQENRVRIGVIRIWNKVRDDLHVVSVERHLHKDAVSVQTDA